MDESTKNNQTNNQETKFCKECGAKIAKKAVICPQCGCQIEEVQKESQPQIVINNSNQNSNENNNVNVGAAIGRPKKKIVALLLCFFLGLVGAHKFYEGKVGMGILYIFTGGLFGIGAIIDFFTLLFKPSIYYVL